MGPEGVTRRGESAPDITGGERAFPRHLLQDPPFNGLEGLVIDREEIRDHVVVGHHVEGAFEIPVFEEPGGDELDQEGLVAGFVGDGLNRGLGEPAAASRALVSSISSGVR